MSKLHDFLQGADEWYNRARASYWFLVAFLVAICAVSFAHYIFGWDSDLGQTNYFLSIDASVSAIMIIIHNARAERYQKHLLEAMHELLQAIAERHEDLPKEE